MVLKLISVLQANITAADFSTYPTSGNKFVVVAFYNYANKAALLNKMRTKKSVMVEEIFSNTKSKSQLYINDHLTPHFNSLFIEAFKAKKEGFLASASSWGGRIRVRKAINDAPITINNRDQLINIINSPNVSTENRTVESEKKDNINQKQISQDQ